MATTNNDQTTVNTDENTPPTAATVNGNVDQTVGNTTADEKLQSTDTQPSSADTKTVEEPTNLQPSPSTTEPVPVDLPQDVQPLTTSAPTKPQAFLPKLTNIASIDIPVSVYTVETANNQPVNFQISSEEGTLVEESTTPKSVHDTVVIANPTNVEPPASKQPSATTRNTGATLVAAIRKSYRLFIVLGVIFLISLFELIIGWNHADDCPAHWRIPHYLVVAGTIGMVIVAIVAVQHLLQPDKSLKTNNTGLTLTVNRGLAVVFLFLSLFSIVWFIAGCIWVFRAWHKVQYRNPRRSNYCHPTLYRVAFWILFLTICFILLLIYRNLRSIIQVIKNKKKGSPKPVPTEEVL